MFLQIHTLTSYHATLLNRDDAGLAKRIPFGDAERLRVSSQCLKRHWREELKKVLEMPAGTRSRHFFAREVYPRVCEQGVEEATARELTKVVVRGLMKEREKGKDGDGDGGKDNGAESSVTGKRGAEDKSLDSLFLKQPVLFGKPEADYLVSLVVKAAQGKELKEAQKEIEDALKQNKENFKAILRQGGHGNLQAGFEGAMFGRFVTSDVLSRVDAPVHVAHSFTVHGLDTEVDYFTVVDDLNLEEETGAAHAGDMELGAGVFYGYVAVDVPLLVSNTIGCDSADWMKQDPEEVKRLLSGLVTAIATVSPGAKLGSTAPYVYSDFVLLEAGKQQPRSLANAFLKAISRKGDVMQESINALANQLKSIEQMYGATAECQSASTTKSWADGRIKSRPLSESTGEILGYIFGASGNGHHNS